MDSISTSELKRLAVSNEVNASLENEVNRIKSKGDYFRVNESRLANLIIELFFSKYIEKEIKYIEAKFFDRKNYLKYLISKSATEADLEVSIDEYLKRSKSPKGRKPRANKPQKEGL